MTKMRQFKIAAAVMFLFFLTAMGARGQDRGFGFGIIVGEPTGLSFKNWLTSTTAIDGGIAWSFYKETTFHLHGDYLIHAFDVIHSRDSIPLYYGVGGRFKAARNGNGRLGLRGVIGLDFFIHRTPLDIFIELAPIMDLTPATELTMNGGLGFRFFVR
jgi:hypothetical protein